MNLDIMSLMAASAAVSDSTQASGKGVNGLASTTDEAGSGTSFLSVLQGFNSSLQNLDDIDPATLTGQPGTAEEPQLPLIIDDTPLPGGQLAALGAEAQSGSLLPENGNDLPPAALLAASGNSPATSADEVATTDVAQPDATFRPNAAGANVMTAADTRMVASAQTATPPQSAGWFTQRNIPHPRPATTTSAPAVASASVEAMSASAQLTAADLRLAPGAERAGALTQTSEPGTAMLADRLQTLAAQSAGFTQSLVASEASGLEAPRSALTSAIGAPAATTPASTTAMPAPLAAPLNLNQSGWDKALGQRLVFMAANGLDSAELRLDPPQLGTVHVKLSMQGDQAQVLLQAANPLARDAMETALPRLREMLGSEGLQLDSAQVSDRDGGDRQREADARREALAQMPGEEGNESADSAASQTHVETLTTATGVISERV